jgi:hypothetical protein
MHGENFISKKNILIAMRMNICKDFNYFIMSGLTYINSNRVSLVAEGLPSVVEASKLQQPFIPA